MSEEQTCVGYIDENHAPKVQNVILFGNQKQTSDMTSGFWVNFKTS